MNTCVIGGNPLQPPLDIKIIDGAYFEILINFALISKGTLFCSNLILILKGTIFSTLNSPPKVKKRGLNWRGGRGVNGA